MDPTRRTALVAGVFYLLTFVSIPTLFLYTQVRGANYVLGAGPDTRVYIGVILEIIVALASIGTAVALFPVVKRQNEGMALGFVATRTVEAGAIFAGAFGLLAIVSLRLAGAGPSELAASQALVGLHDWAFTLGQSLMPAMNALLLGTLLYQSRLVPRALPLLGLIGAPLLIASVVLTVTGVVDYGSGLNGLLALPIALWEFSLGVYLVAKGFRAQGLRKLGFAPDVPASQSVAASDAAASELRPAA
jgi:hypothetical protein